ncbi:MAG: hypothetical protein ACJA2W_001933, partial [Planctomycetota bacterium]
LAADFMEVLARAPRALLGSSSDGSREPRAAKGRRKTASNAENPDPLEPSVLLENRARWPRLAAWARFAEIRAAATVPLTSITETTLF